MGNQPLPTLMKQSRCRIVGARAGKSLTGARGPDVEEITKAQAEKG
ncbi:hypothetical protein [Streptomyces gobiensis]|nr:hypothetical protein [Streptomyces gobiensis]UGY92838.1 hypothetical protein test1122_14755 [Streptomyces gobiensis]